MGSVAPFPISRTLRSLVGGEAAEATPVPATAASPAAESTAARPRPSHLVPRRPRPATELPTEPPPIPKSHVPRHGPKFVRNIRSPEQGPDRALFRGFLTCDAQRIKPDYVGIQRIPRGQAGPYCCRSATANSAGAP